LKHDSAPSIGGIGIEAVLACANYHLIALFCTVAANGLFATQVTTKNFNEIKDLEAISQAKNAQNLF